MRHGKILFAVLVITALLAGGCAFHGAPSGGPEDKTPPAVLSVSPAADSLHVPRDRDIRITFSKWIRPDNADHFIFISPTRPSMRIKISGRTLRITPDSLLRDSTTYVITLGAELQDFRGNKLPASLTYSFSTGGFLDTARIQGSVCDENGAPMPQGFSVFAYLAPDTGAVNPAKTVPDYITQSGLDGSFLLRNLRYGRYRLFGVSDLNTNRRFDTGRELLALPSRDALVAPRMPADTGFVLVAGRSDTLPLRLERAALNPGGLLSLSFSKALSDSAIEGKAAFSISPLDSSAEGAVHPDILSVLPAPDDSTLCHLLIGPTDSRRKYRVAARGLRSVDGSALDTARSSLTFAGDARPDSMAPQIRAQRPVHNSTAVQPGDSVVLLLSEPVREKALMDAFRFFRLAVTRKTGDSSVHPDTARVPVAGRSYFRSALMFVFVPDSLLAGDTWYGWMLDPHQLIDGAGNFAPESLFTGRFKTLNPDELGSLSGTVLGADPTLLRIGVLGAAVKKRIELTPEKNGYFAVDGLPEGAYRVLAYRDRNSNRHWDKGALSPFNFAEPLAVAYDSVSVRKRWTVEGLDIRMQEIK